MKRTITAIRSFRVIYNSRTDFIDFWLNAILVILAIHLFVVQPIEKVEYYRFMISNGITSNGMSLVSFITGIGNLIRILTPFKMNVFLVSGMKAITMAFHFFLFFSILNNSVMPISAIYYGMVAILAFDNTMRTR